MPISEKSSAIYQCGIRTIKTCITRYAIDRGASDTIAAAGILAAMRRRAKGDTGFSCMVAGRRAIDELMDIAAWKK